MNVPDRIVVAGMMSIPDKLIVAGKRDSTVVVVFIFRFCFLGRNEIHEKEKVLILFFV